MKKINNLVEKAIENISVNSFNEGMAGIPSGFVKLDAITQGFHGGELTVIASRPGMGKSSFLSTMVKNISIDFNYSTLFISLESKSTDVINRMICSETGFEYKKIRRGNLEPYEWEHLNRKVENLLKAPIYIDDNIDFSIDSIRKRIIEYVENNEIDIVFIDYIQLISLGKNKKQSREEELSIIVKELKLIARKYDLPIVITSQLSRNLETRGFSKRPLLNDIRDSGAIEDDADLVCFLYRPEHYGMTEWDDDDHSPCEGQAEIIIAKHRNGELDNIRLNFIKQLFKFSDLEDFEFDSSINEFNDYDNPPPF